MDFDPDGKEKIFQYLKEKYGEERVLSVGTFSRLGPSAAAKDLLRVYKIDFKESNGFTKLLDQNLSWNDNIEKIKSENPIEYKFYEKHKSVIDLVPFFIGKIRQGSKHAGGVVLLDEPIWKRVPVERVNGELVTAFPESSQEQVLDEIGITKLDILAVTTLDVIKNAINMVQEKIYLIEEDGIQKIVPESYLNKEIEQF
jgi:DNA polymerase III subunit alpha